MKRIIALAMALLIVMLPFTLAEINATTETTLEVALPDYWNKKEIDITGKTSPNANVELYVNGVLSRINDPAFTGESGLVAFYGVGLKEGSNEVRIAANKAKEVKKSIIVDTSKPVLTISPIKNITFSKSINFTGTASEAGMLNIYAQFKKGADKTPPPKIDGLHAEDVKEYSIKLGWNATDEKDFFRYVVYREDIGALATVSSQRSPMYVDSKVEAGSKYKYSISAVDKSANEGEKSDEIEVETLEGEAKNISKPSSINVTEVIASKMIKAFNVSGSFSGSFLLEEGDGSYSITFELEDKAKNKDDVEKEVLLDTTAPKIELISPTSGDFVYENFADQVTFVGRTEPFAVVHLFVERTPFGSTLNASFDVAGLSERLETLPESSLTADCIITVGKKRECKGGADYSTKADEEGNFRIENVDLTSIAALGLNIESVSPQNIDNLRREGTAASRDVARRRFDSVKANLLFIATDQAGKRGIKQSHINIGNCWSGDFKFDAIPLIEYQTPTFLSPERISEGTETMQFLMNISYIGEGDSRNVQIKSLQMMSACDDVTKSNSLTNLSCKIMPGSCSMKPLYAGSSVYYSNCKLKRHPGLSTWTKNDWNGLFRALKGHEMIFPFKVTVAYTETLPLEDVESSFNEETGTSTFIPEDAARATVRQVNGVQTFCQPVAYTIDDSRINPKEVLPDWLLYDAVDWLNSSIYYMNKAQEVVDGVLRVAGFSCASSIILVFVTGVYRRWSCSFETGLKKLETLTEAADVQRKNDCQTCLEHSPLDSNKMGDGKKYKDWKDFDQKEMSDTCLKKCYPTCASGWSAESTMYTGMRWTCDRFLGHPAPSAWTEEKKDEELIKKAEDIADSCNSDGGVSGVPLTAGDCIKLAAKYKVESQFTREEKCVEGFDERKQPVMYQLGDKESSNDKNDGNVWKLLTKEGNNWGFSKPRYAISDDGEHFTTNKAESCQELCAGPKESKGLKDISFEKNNKGEVTSISIKESSFTQTAVGFCDTSSNCETYAIDREKFGETIPKDVTATRLGYTQDCFYNGYSVKKDPNGRVECCCLKIKGLEKNTKDKYYHPEDVENKDILDAPVPVPATNFKEMQFSYRYSREKWNPEPNGDDKEYNPYRYISGRDRSACFGQNNWIFDELLRKEGEEGSILVLDPAKQTTSAFQCLAINQIQARLSELKNMMTALQSCLITVRTTGTADAGVCKELFTQYVCSSLWRVIQAFRDKCSPLELPDPNVDLGITDYFSKGVSGVFDSAAGTQKLLGEEYNNVALNNFLGIGEEAFARKICLAAFGYDWELGFDKFMDVAYTTPFATLVQPVTATREYIGYDPKYGKSKYEYRSSWIINPGCDIDSYRVYLTCVTDEELGKPGVDCSAQNEINGNNCDCLAGKRQVSDAVLKSGSRVKQGELLNQDAHDIKTEIQRYDHLKFVLKPNVGIQKNLKSSCFPEGNEDGVFYFPITDKTAQDIADCRVDATSGVFACDQGIAFLGNKGTASIEGIEIESGVRTITKEFTRQSGSIRGLYYGDELSVKPWINRGAGPDVCLEMELEGAQGPEGTPLIMGITTQGSNDYGLFNLGKLKQVTGPRLDYQSSQFTLSYGTITNDKVDSTLTIEFIDGDSPVDGKITFSADSKDKVKINGDGEGTISEGHATFQGFGTEITLTPKGAITPGQSFKITVVNPSSTISTKKLNLRLNYLTADAEGKFNSPEDCNINDPVKGGEKTYNLEVKQKPTNPCERTDGKNKNTNECLCGTTAVCSSALSYCLIKDGGEGSCSATPLQP
ncbi:fibronectin type III domain-containing protein [Candidatus Woesearchaeota archaeon]|nr:fibronectin type III domain-containing protein [Candidatus Woesearchaeota archaeon]